RGFFAERRQARALLQYVRTRTSNNIVIIPQVESPPFSMPNIFGWKPVPHFRRGSPATLTPRAPRRQRRVMVFTDATEPPRARPAA
ncbi:MAG: hypothetical protein NTV08_17515, partial [Verrucomicrobia bacterium]|nr:hypothetical protein [Verrucomicrobiota bacterium]